MTVGWSGPPDRILATLDAVGQGWGGREIVVARELTKQFEEVVRGPAARLRERFAGGTARGEFTLILPSPRFEPATSEAMVE